MASLIRYAAYPTIMSAVLVAALMVATGAAPAWPLLAGAAAAGIVLVAALERRLPFQRAWTADRGDTRADVVHGLVNWGLLSGGAVVVHAVTLALALPAVWPTAWPVWAQLLAVAVIFDLGLYAVHVLSHRWPWAWRLHAIHHSAERLYWLNGERRHPLSAALIAAPGLATLAVLGAPPLIVSSWLAVIAVHLAFQHANLDYRLGPLRRWIAGAETHRWHHKRDYEDAQVNFGEFLLVWDRLFGTFAEPAAALHADEVGLRRRDMPASWLEQLRWPFAMPAELREAFEARLAAGDADLRAGRAAEALAHYEAAHILSQTWTGPHVRSHVAMLRWSMAEQRSREFIGQVSRIVAAALFTWTWVPRGNPGSTRVGALARRPVPRDLDLLLSKANG
jgi:sterol desaturase/sphingolipid hydroxylase (fatty acid hydroxylase superfamily)